jgi:hypothetical protein
MAITAASRVGKSVNCAEKKSAGVESRLFLLYRAVREIRELTDCADDEQLRT